MPKEWRLLPAAPESFSKQFTFPPLIAQLLYNRNLQSQNDIDYFFNPDYGQLLSPFLFKDMPRAVERVWRAIERQEKIVVHGDYDADGVTSAAVLWKTLKILGANVEVFIPHREWDGYGLNLENVQNFFDDGCRLLITVDCGITNIKEVEFLNSRGVDVIVTDHHEPLAELPAALALLDPKVADSGYPFRDLSGAGVAYKLAQALLSQAKPSSAAALESFGGAEGFQKWLLDIVAIGTIADVVPLLNENRILVKWGLVVLKCTRHLGLQKLLEVIGNRRLDAETVAFQIAPRLNAAGRMNHATAAFKLLITEDPAEAAALAQELQQQNQLRQKITGAYTDQARAQLVSQLESQTILFAYHEFWEPGLIGLIAGKLSDDFYRPVIVMTNSQGTIVGSGRSIPGFNITQGLVAAQSWLKRFGGHSQACGFTLLSLEQRLEFQSTLGQYALENLNVAGLQPFEEIEAKIKLAELDWPVLDQLEKFEPFGEGNVRPQFLIENLEVVNLETVGNDGQHLRLLVKESNPTLYKMMAFGRAKACGLSVGDKISVICELGVSEWNGRKEKEFKLVDFRLQDVQD